MLKITMAKRWGFIISFIIGTIFGSGSLWRYYDHQRESTRIKIEKIEVIIKLSTQLNDLYDEIIFLSNEYCKYENENQSNNDLNSQQKASTYLKLSNLKEAFVAIELQLAEFLYREPRELSLDFIPPAIPQIISIEAR